MRDFGWGAMSLQRKKLTLNLWKTNSVLLLVIERSSAGIALLGC